jgi:hypothetical protein
MAKFNNKSVDLAISTAPTTINTVEETFGNYTRFKVEQFDIPIPDSDKMTDAGTVGDGVGYEQNIWHYRWKPTGLSLRGKLDDKLFPILFARILGGTVVDAVVTASTSYNHTIPMATELELVRPKLSNIVVKGNADFIYADMYPESLTITQNKDESPMFEAQMSNTGLFKKISDSTLVVGSIPAVSSTYYAGLKYHGAATTLVYNNGSSQDLTAARGLISVSAKLTQPCDVVNLPGDSFLTSGDVASGSYAGTIDRKSQEQDIITLRYFADSPLSHWSDMKAGTVLTNLILKFQGKVIGASTDKYETEVKLTRAQVVSVTGSTEGEYEAFDVVIKALPDSTTKRLCIGRVQNGTATLT